MEIHLTRKFEEDSSLRFPFSIKESKIFFGYGLGVCVRGGDQGGVEGAKAPPEKFWGGFYIKKPPPHKISPKVENSLKCLLNKLKKG